MSRALPLCVAVLAGWAVMAARPAAAAGAHTLSVGATVLSKNNCRFTNSGPTALSFGAIDPSSSGNATATATTTFRCTGSNATAAYAISSDDGLFEAGSNQPRMRHDSDPTQFLRYSVSLPQSGTAPKNVEQTMTLSGSISSADFQNALAGAYSDTLTLTIVP